MVIGNGTLWYFIHDYNAQQSKGLSRHHYYRIIPNHKREATDRASSIESLPTREAMTDLVISERRFLTKSLN
ncbi:MAG: hypothetical protein ACK5WL_14600, partial [Pseudanabaena sp.]